MKSYIVLGFLLVSLACVLGGESRYERSVDSGTKEVSADKYKNMLNAFETKVKRIYRELSNKALDEKEFVNSKLEGSMAAVRPKRETEQQPDIQSQIQSAFQNMQKMFDEAKNSDSAKLFMDKLNEFGANIQKAGQQVGDKVQETLSQFSQKPSS